MPTVLMERNNLADAFVRVNDGPTKEALAAAKAEVGEAEWKKGFTPETREAARAKMKEQGARYETKLEGQLVGVGLAETEANGEKFQKLRVTIQNGEDRTILSADLNSEFAQRLVAKLQTAVEQHPGEMVSIGGFASPKERDDRQYVDHVAVLKDGQNQEIPAAPGHFETAKEAALTAQKPMLDAGMEDKKVLNQIARSAREKHFAEVVRELSEKLTEKLKEQGFEAPQARKPSPRLEAHLQEPDGAWRSVGLWADKEGKLVGMVATERTGGEKERLPVTFTEKLSKSGTPLLQAVAEREDKSRVFVSLMPHEAKNGEKFISASFAEKEQGQELRRIEGRGGGLKPNQTALEQGAKNPTVQVVREKLGVNVLENVRSQQQTKSLEVA